ncbi:papain-like cysteine protease family protein [Cystobacter ferrugineus]|uniref:Peptidase C39-like domain-containing protein n=1 Tax=Cystobacter ferrugineus TaxID=83449 RepID=A0A1L9BG62_9BACT|nr:papain-like cysteine protease family protein [Cystobacter ferrugineus]OJH41215.1 hypothetical protein BON30_10060 [Cystobacter ferrugineus]
MSLTIPPSTVTPPRVTKTSTTPEPTPEPTQTPPPPKLTKDLETVKDDYQQALESQKEWLIKYGAPKEQIEALDKAIEQHQESVLDLNNSRNSQNNVVALDQKDEGGWSSEAPVLQQEGNSDCGETVAAMFKGAKEGRETVEGERGQGVIDDFKSRFTKGDGTTPTEMADMLTSEGLEVKHSSKGLERNAMDEALRNGDKAAVMLDSKISGSPDDVSGSPHWVLIDGMDSQGRYLVKDPSNGSSYYAKPEDVANAIDTSQSKNHSGGVLIVGNPDVPTDLAGQNRNNAETLGDKPGTGWGWKKNTDETSSG